MHRMNGLERHIIKGLILFLPALFLISCQGAVKSHQTIKPPGSELDIYQQAIHKAYLWIDMHPAEFEDEGLLPILEEIIAFYMLWKNTKDPLQKMTYLNDVRARIDLLASKGDFEVQPKEYTVFLTVAMLVEKLQIRSLDFRKIIENQIISSPYLFSQQITNTIWNTVYLERLGYHPPMDLTNLIPRSNLHQELQQKLLFQLVSGPSHPIPTDTLILTVYHMTHEIFSLTHFGESPPPSFITDNQAFFAKFFDKTIQWAMAVNHIDLLGELIMCVKILDLKDVPSLQQGIEYILSTQEDNGTFGITNPTLPNVYRHGILVAMMALSMV